MKTIFSFLAFQIFSIFPLLAILDTNANGLSDVWEKQYNTSQLFSATNTTHAATADPDQDGWTNAQEALAGTNPFSANGPNGKTALAIQPTTTAATYELTWPVVPGKNYRIQASTNLHFWVNIGPIIDAAANDTAHTIAIQATDPENTSATAPPPKLFYRVKVIDRDEDSDILTTAEEFVLGLNAASINTLSGINDLWLVTHFYNELLTVGLASIAANPDPDGDGATNVDESLAGSSPHDPDSLPIDIDGDSVANGLDADPNQKKINWIRSKEGSYIVVDLQMQPLAQFAFLPFGRENVPAVLNDHNQICRSPYIDLGEKTPATWDGSTFPVIWHSLPDYIDGGEEPFTFKDFNHSFGNDGHTYNALLIDRGTVSSPGATTLTVKWAGLLSTPSPYGDYSEEYTGRTVQSRFNHLATVEDIWSDLSSGTNVLYSLKRTITAPEINLTATTEPDEATLYLHSFNLYSNAPHITRTGKVLLEENNTLKISNIEAPSNTIYGMTADPHDNTIVAIPGTSGAQSVSTMRHRNGAWELMPMPGIMDMNANGVGITFPDQQLWRNGKSLQLDDLLSDSGWNSFKAEQINEKGAILGSAKLNGGSSALPVLLLPCDLDVIHPATGEFAETREDGTVKRPDGGFISLKRTIGSDVLNSKDTTPVTKLKIHALAGAKQDWKTRIHFDNGDRYNVFKDPARTELVVSQVTEFPANADTILYFQGEKKSTSRGGEKITLQVKIGNQWYDGDSVVCTVVQSEFLVQVKAFIPYEWSEGETLWVANETINPMDGLVVHGDYVPILRPSFKNEYSDVALNFATAPYRLCQEIILTPYLDLHDFWQDKQGSRRFSSAPSSDHYEKATAVDPTEMALQNGYKPLKKPIKATGPPILGATAYNPYLQLSNSLRDNECGMNIQASGKDGAMGNLAAAAPSIDWDVNLEIDATADPLQPKYIAKGKHDLYPAYEVIILQADGTFTNMHQHMPGRHIFPGLYSLGTATIYFNHNGTITK